MNKILVRSAVTTVLLLVVAALVALAVLNYGFPQHMATAYEKLGNYGVAAKYAARRYDETGDINDLARVVDNSVYAERDDYIIKYGAALIADEQFDSFCLSRDEAYKNTNYAEYTGSYKQFVCGNVAVAYYRGDDLKNAVEVAASANGTESFINHNALMTLSLAVATEKDVAAASEILEVLGGITPVDEQEIVYLEDMVSILSEL